METGFNETLLIKYFLRKSTEEENKCIYEWLIASPEHKKEFNRLKYIWHLSSIRHIYRHISIEQDLQALTNKLYHRKAYWEKIKLAGYTSVAVAAIFTLVMIIPHFKTSIKETSFPDIKNTTSTEIHIPNGLKGNITLADGTEVWLNSGSRIIYPEDYSATNRSIYLDGEAYFEVKSDKAHPFVVETSRLNVVVTGTRFNLSSYAEDHTIEATLCQGIITLNYKDGQKALRLNPNDKVTYNKKDGEIQKEIVDSELSASWKDGILSFKEVPLREILRKLERKFNTTIRIQDRKAGEYTYTATFEKDKGLEDILNIITISAPISYQKENDGSITILQT